MNLCCRVLLKAIAMFPVVGSVIPTSQEIPTLIEGLVVPAKPEHLWNWWVSDDGSGEVYHSAASSYEDAVRLAKGCGGGLIAECKQQDFYLEVQGYEILELIDQKNEEVIGDEGGIQCTDEQSQELGRVVSAAIEDWVKKNKIYVTAWVFGGVRNKIIVQEMGEVIPVLQEQRFG